MELRKQRAHVNSQIHDLEGLLEQGQKEFGFSIEEIEQMMDADDAEDLGLDENLIMEILPVGHRFVKCAWMCMKLVIESFADAYFFLDVDTACFVLMLDRPCSILNKVAEPVPEAMFNSPELDELVNKMIYTMTMFDGVGLAAPQVGESLRLLVLEQDNVDPTPRCVV